MKLRNKKTGRIYDLSYLPQIEPIVELLLDGSMERYEEEPKEEWYINCTGEILENNKSYCNMITPEKLQSIGNYFETEEEAEKAVEKLKAWKRLKDKGFKFQFWTSSYSGDNISFFIDWINADSKKEIEKDLDLLFGGE